MSLVAESGADCNTLTACRTAAAENGGTALGLHARAKAVGLHAAAPVGLKCALGHKNALLFPLKILCHVGKYLVYRRLGQESSVRGFAREW